MRKFFYYPHTEQSLRGKIWHRYEARASEKELFHITLSLKIEIYRIIQASKQAEIPSLGLAHLGNNLISLKHEKIFEAAVTTSKRTAKFFQFILPGKRQKKSLMCGATSH